MPSTMARAAVQSTPVATSISSSEPAANAPRNHQFAGGTWWGPADRCRVVQRNTHAHMAPHAGWCRLFLRRAATARTMAQGRIHDQRLGGLLNEDARLLFLRIGRRQESGVGPQRLTAGDCVGGFRKFSAWREPHAASCASFSRLQQECHAVHRAAAHLVDDVHGAAHHVAQHCVQRLVRLPLVHLRRRIMV